MRKLKERAVTANKTRQVVVSAVALFMALALGASAFACPPDEELGFIHLPVENIQQNPELPNGCEITSLAVVLNYMGLEADKTDLATQYLPRADWGDPDEVYVGNPASVLGWYCFAGPVVTAANTYLSAQKSSLSATDITGASEQTLRDCLAGGRPVIVWVTIDWHSPRTVNGVYWRDAEGHTFAPYENLHCLVLTGYDDAKDVFLIANPLSNTNTVGRELFLSVFEAMGSRAVIIG